MYHEGYCGESCGGGDVVQEKKARRTVQIRKKKTLLTFYYSQRMLLLLVVKVVAVEILYNTFEYVRATHSCPRIHKRMLLYLQ